MANRAAHCRLASRALLAAKKNRPRTARGLSATKLVKEMARERIGAVPPSKVVPDKSKGHKPPKHKKKLPDWE